ncbi:ATP-binding response regulator [Mongoliitalea lutea]|uniref:histidine kinase n=1 Tax=Mongoliitalea lutea TaxID=849756 RepID=A0A8J3CVP6_9BACT|nr:response regulator [Mongoliitalea lutea]GHB35354.1 hypothetical protein GCM10008106_15980 [Mongoliitalea lutea]
MTYRILLAEDEAELRENVAEILELSGYHVVSVKNGLEALAVLESDVFDVVISDIMMPEIDGFELLKAFRKKEYLLETPFIFLTAKMDQADQRKGMESGAEDYLVKPVKARDLIAAIDIALKKRETRNRLKFAELKQLFGKQRKVFFHEMNTPLAGVIASLELLKAYGSTIAPEDFDLFINQALDASKRLDASLKMLKKYQTLDFIQITPINIASIGDFLKDHISKKIDYQGVCVEIKHDFSISFTEEHFKEIVDQLLKNASSFVSDEKPVSIIIDFPTLTIINNQNLFSSSQEIKAEPFQQFKRDVFEQQGFGLGMFIAQELAEKNDAVLKFKINKNLEFEAILSFGSTLIG